MALITDNTALQELCGRLSKASYITVDTEFMREKTYWPILCLVQVAGPDEAWAIDPLAEGLDLSPLFALFADEKILKVFPISFKTGIFDEIIIFFKAAASIIGKLLDV